VKDDISDGVDMVQLLEELRDIVEQIDYARAFVALQGLPFLLGCASQNSGDISMGVRAACVACLHTLAQNNPPVQQALLEQDAVHQLAEIYFDDSSSPSDDHDEKGYWELKGKSVQAINAIVRGHKAAEELFAKDHLCRLIILQGLEQKQRNLPVPASLRRRCLFFLRALICGDLSSRERVRLFSGCIQLVIPLVNPNIETDDDIRQSALEIVLEILTQRKSVDFIMRHKNVLLDTGVPRVAALRALPEGSEEKEYRSMELETWEALIVAIAKDYKDEEVEENEDGEQQEQVLMLEGRSNEEDFRNAPQ